MLDFPLTLWVKEPVVDRIQPKINKFVTVVENKATSDSKLNDSPVKNVNCAVPEKISILGPQKRLEFPGGGVL